LPDLDTRTWADLVDEGRSLIPTYAPGWTDHNIHDPGITLLELLGWLVELDVYRLNRVPDTHRRKFLSLAGFPQLPPSPATTVLAVTPAAPVDVPAGVAFVSTTTTQTAAFRGASVLHAEPVTLQSLLVQFDATSTPLDATRALQGGAGIQLLGGNPAPGAAAWFGFDRLPVGKPFHLGLTFQGGRSGADERARIEAEWPPDSAGLLRHHSAVLVWEIASTDNGWVTLEPALGQVRDDSRQFTLDGTLEFQVPARLTLAGPPVYLRARLTGGAYDAAPVLHGVAVNALPCTQSAMSAQAYRVAAGASIQGTPPAAPSTARLLLAFDATQPNLLTALSFVDDQSVPEMTLLAYVPPASANEGLLVLDRVCIGRANGLPLQSFTLPQAAVAGASLALATLEVADSEPTGFQWRQWQAATDLFGAGARDAVFALDPTAGVVQFGNGDRGRIPPAGAVLLAQYAATAGASGNGAASQTWTLAPTIENWSRLDPVDLSQQVGQGRAASVAAADPARAWSALSFASYEQSSASLGNLANLFGTGGGADAESVDQAAGRAIQALQTPTRAATTADIETLVLQTPGTAIARVRALPGQYLPYPGLVAPGVVSVIVVPASPTAQPTPSSGLLNVVGSYLDRRRVVGSHLEIAPPSYLAVQVIASVQAQAGVVPSQLTHSVVAALKAFLDPLNGGPAVLYSPPTLATTPRTGLVGAAPGVSQVVTAPPAAAPPIDSPPIAPGWPFGRPVYRAEVLQAIRAVPGVDSVLSLELNTPGGTPSCSNLCVGPTELVTSAAHSISVQPAR
jgi:hypothetical protein